MNLYDLEDISVELGGRTVLEIPSHSIGEGGICALIGANGSGKTSLLRVLGALLPPVKGSVACRGQDIYSSENSMHGVRSETGFLLQHPYMFKGSVRQNVAYGLRLRGMEKAQCLKSAEKYLDMVGLTALVDKPACGLSGGETRRVGLARTIATRPKVLLLDEPFAGVDPSSASVIEKILIELNRRNGVSIIFATHDAGQAFRLASETIGLHAGGLIPPPTKNMFQGRIENRAGGDYFISGDFAFAIPSGHEKAHAAMIPPESILISFSAVNSSARNAFKGKVVKIEDINGSVEVVADTGVHLTTMITVQSYKDMGLTIGQDIFLVFKAESVRLY